MGIDGVPNPLPKPRPVTKWPRSDSEYEAGGKEGKAVEFSPSVPTEHRKTGGFCLRHLQSQRDIVVRPSNHDGQALHPDYSNGHFYQDAGSKVHPTGKRL